MLKILFLFALVLCSAYAMAEPAAVQTEAHPSTLTINTAHRLLDEGRDADAIGILEQLVQNTPTDFHAWFLLGVTQAQGRHFNEAVISFGKVVALQPKLAEPHNNLAVIYNELGNYRAAVKELETSLKLKPEYATAQENIGDLYVKLAADAYRKALKEGGRPALRQRYNRLLHINKVNEPVTADATTSQSTVPAPTDANKIAVQPAMQQADIKAVLVAVEAWRSAWSRQDLPAYFAAYSNAFEFSKRFETLEEWKRYKRSVITKKTFIRVTLENMEATKLPGGEIRLTFLQHFRSDSFNSDDIKTMMLRQTRDGWKIIYEASK